VLDTSEQTRRITNFLFGKIGVIFARAGTAARAWCCWTWGSKMGYHRSLRRNGLVRIDGMVVLGHKGRPCELLRRFDLRRRGPCTSQYA
jgi:hypothetical protein